MNLSHHRSRSNNYCAWQAGTIKRSGALDLNQPREWVDRQRDGKRDVEHVQPYSCTQRHYARLSREVFPDGLRSMLR